MKAKKVLIISYHSLPMDVVSSYRIKAYCDYLSNYDVIPTLLTHQWDVDNTNKWKFHSADNDATEESFEGYNVIRLPRPKPNNHKIRALSRLLTLMRWIKGDLDIELFDSYKVFRSFLFSHLRKERYDLIIAVFSPHNHLKLAYEAHKKFRIPYILDFRDLWDNRVVTPSYKPTIKEKMTNEIVKFWWGKWLRSSLFFTTTGNLWRNYLTRLSFKDGFIVRNGFEGKMIERAEYKTNKFKIIHFGRIYKTQDLTFFLEAFSKFLEDKPSHKITLELIGLKLDGDFDAMDLIKSYVPSIHISQISYMSKSDLVKYCRAEAILFWLPNFKENNGQFMVKLYDYIKIGKPILLCPTNGSELEEVINYTRTGVLFDSKEMLTQYLNRCYEEYISTGSIRFEGNTEKINEFRREKQVENLAKLIHKYT